MDLLIENPRVPGSIPGRGTITQKPCTQVRGFFVSVALSALGTRWRVPVAAPRVTIPGRGTIIQEALAAMRGLF